MWLYELMVIQNWAYSKHHVYLWRFDVPCFFPHELFAVFRNTFVGQQLQIFEITSDESDIQFTGWLWPTLKSCSNAQYQHLTIQLSPALGHLRLAVRGLVRTLARRLQISFLGRDCGLGTLPRFHSLCSRVCHVSTFLWQVNPSPLQGKLISIRVFHLTAS